ncbi:MAG: hypothetical protein EA370_03995 [Wenzhouxiangella sp.]|nr:MAG: hypothetical protein EA370_03995 [Wenzhouxiangella sp.]
MRVGRWIIAIICLLLLAALAGHFYLARQVESQLEKLASQLVLAGRLSWERILIHPRGEIHISAVRFEPRDARDLLRIDAVTFRSQNLAQLVRALQDFERNEVPRGILVSLRGGRLPVGPPFNDWMDGRVSPILPHAGAGCDFDARRLTDLNRLDYWELAIDGQFHYQIVVEGEQLDMGMRLAVGQLADWRARARLELDEPLSSIHEVASALAASRLLMAELDLHDLGFYERLHSHCAQALELSRERWLEQHLNAWRRAWAEQGLAPDDIAESAYRTFLNQPGSISLATRTAPPQAPARLDDFSKAAALPGLDIFLRIDESTPVALRFAAITPARPARLTEPEPPAPAQAPVVRESPIAPELIDPTTQALPVVAPSGWRGVSPASANQYINQSVRLLLHDETWASGRLIAVDEQALYLEIRSRHGLLTRPFSHARIDRFYVRDQG